MSNEGAAAPAPSAPQSPAGVAQPAPQGPVRRRLSDMEVGLEQHNERMSDPRPQRDPEPGVDFDGARVARPERTRQDLDAGLEQPAELAEELPAQDELEPPPAADPRAMQEQDQQLLDATKAWLEGRGEMPDAFKGQVHEWTDKATGAPRRMTLPQMEEACMRQSDYSSKMNELRGYHQQVQFREQAAGRLEQAFRDPEQLFVEMQNRDPAVLHQIAVKYSIQRAKMKQVAEGAGYALMQQHGYQPNHPDVVNAVRQSMQAQEQAQRVDIENRKLREHNQMLAQMRQQQDGQQQRQVRLQELGAAITPLIAPSFKSAGVLHNPRNVEDFYRHLTAYVASLPNWDGNVRRRDCIEAAKMVREEIDDRNAARAPKKAAPQSRAMPPSRLSSSGSAQPTQNERKRVSDMQNDTRFGQG